MCHTINIGGSNVEGSIETMSFTASKPPADAPITIIGKESRSSLLSLFDLSQPFPRIDSANSPVLPGQVRTIIRKNWLTYKIYRIIYTVMRRARATTFHRSTVLLFA